MTSGTETGQLSNSANRSWWSRHPWQTRALLVAGVCVVLAAACILPGIFFGIIFGTRSHGADLATVSRRAQVKFPPSARLRHSLEIEHFIDLEVYAEVEIDRRDAEAFVATLKKDPEFVLSRRNRFGVSNSLRNWRQSMPVPEWWKPDAAQNYIACLTYLRLLLISLDDPNRATIWIHTDTDGPPSHVKRRWFPESYGKRHSQSGS